MTPEQIAAAAFFQGQMDAVVRFLTENNEPLARLSLGRAPDETDVVKAVQASMLGYCMHAIAARSGSEHVRQLTGELMVTLESTPQIERESTPLSDAQRLASALNRTLYGFIVVHGALLRRTAGVPESVEALDEVTVCTFLGHTIERLWQTRGFDHTKLLMNNLLQQIDDANELNCHGTHVD